MKKILILFILLYGHLYALERESTLKMYHQIFSAVSSKICISVYTNDKEYIDVFIHSKKVSLSEKPEEADIILITDEATLNFILRRRRLESSRDKKPLLFVTDYRFLERSTDIVGAFYWRKGRSQLLFIEERLKQHHVVLPKAYQKFIIDRL